VFNHGYVIAVDRHSAFRSLVVTFVERVGEGVEGRACDDLSDRLLLGLLF
jgi:hypothetical protein